MSRKIFVLIAGLAFLMCLISMFFGASIYNANDNVHVQYLNEMDRINYYDVEQVPALTRMAAILSMPFLIAIGICETYVIRKTKISGTKKIATALALITVAVMVLAIMTLSNPTTFDFSQWGFVWIFAGLFTIAGNGVSVFMKGS